jgi:hypothetical protein
VRLGHIGIDEDDGDVFLERHAQGEIDGRERLALAGHGARHHDDLSVGQLLHAAARGARDERALDLAILIGERALLVFRRHQARGAQRLPVDAYHFVGAVFRLRATGNLCSALGAHDFADDIAPRCRSARRAQAVARGLHFLDGEFDETHGVPIRRDVA